jgi:hypothetical protein
MVVELDLGNSLDHFLGYHETNVHSEVGSGKET